MMKVLDEMKFCKDCRHFQVLKIGNLTSYSKSTECGHESAIYYDLVTGELRHFSAGTLRNSGVDTDCGEEGKYWEPILKEVA